LEPTELLAVRLAIALGIGLMIGAERERRKGTGPSRAPAGIRTFALVSLVGGISLALGGELLVAVAALGVAGLSIVAYRPRGREDPGFTTGIALLTALLLGALAMRQPAVATGVGVVVAVLLAARTRVHRFVRDVLTEQELQDALLFAAAALVVLARTPDRRGWRLRRDSLVLQILTPRRFQLLRWWQEKRSLHLRPCCQFSLG